jgi:hypothetical protein
MMMMTLGAFLINRGFQMYSRAFSVQTLLVSKNKITTEILFDKEFFPHHKPMKMLIFKFPM